MRDAVEKANVADEQSRQTQTYLGSVIKEQVNRQRDQKEAEHEGPPPPPPQQLQQALKQRDLLPVVVEKHDDDGGGQLRIPVLFSRRRSGLGHRRWNQVR